MTDPSNSHPPLQPHVGGPTLASLVASALEEAEQSSPAVKAAALLSLSRIVYARDPADGVRVLERGIALAHTLGDPARFVLLSNAFTVAAMLSPDHAFRLLAELADVQLIHIGFALDRMIEHGHHDAANRYLLSAPEEPDFPFDAIDQAVHATTDSQTRLALLRKAVRVVRHAVAAESTGLPHALSEFLRLLNDHWRALPAEEAGALVREFAAAIVAAPNDVRGTYTLQDARFTSTRQYLLFALLGPCRHLEPPLADSLVADYPQLAKAAARHPNGLPSAYDIPEQLVAHSTPPEPPPERNLADEAQMDYLSLDGAWLPVAEELRTDFERSFAIALNSYAIDTDPRRPNTAPQHCWPSAHNFRSILYKAGVYEGRTAIRHLDRVADPALRLFAQIELAAALAGVSQLGGMMLNQMPVVRSSELRNPPSGDAGVGVEPMPVMPPPFPGKPDVPPSYDVRITLSRHEDGMVPNGGCDADFWVLQRARLRPVLAELFDISPVRIVLPDALEDVRYDFTLVLPREESREVLFATMKAGVERHFKVTRQPRTVDARIVTAARGVRAYESLRGSGEAPACWDSSFEMFYQSPSAPDLDTIEIAALMDLSAVPAADSRPGDDLPRTHGSFLRGMGGATLRGIDDSLTMTGLCAVLESSSNRIFVDETGATATYRINIHADVADSEAFLKVLCDDLGLTVTSGRREIEMLVVEGDR